MSFPPDRGGIGYEASAIRSRHANADPARISTPIIPGAADDVGDRMILAPQEVRPDWSDEDIRKYVTELARR